MMKLLFASDSFKGTLDSGRTAELLEKAAREVFGSCECLKAELAAGGEGAEEGVFLWNGADDKGGDGENPSIWHRFDYNSRERSHDRIRSHGTRRRAVLWGRSQNVSNDRSREKDR